MEETIFTIQPSIKPIIFLYILVFILAVTALFAPFSFLKIILGASALIALIEALLINLKRNFTFYTLTSDNVKCRGGIIGKKEAVIPLGKVQNVTSNFSIIQRVLAIGDVTVESAAENKGSLVFKNIPNPEDYAKRILGAAEKYSGNNQP